MSKRAGNTGAVLLGILCAAGCLLVPARAEDALNQEALLQDPNFPRNPSPSEQVAMLREESLDQGFFRLRNVNLFFSPGVPYSGEIIWEDTMTVSEQSEFLSVQTITSNRRVLKIHEELAALPKAEAVAVLNAHLQEMFAEYRTAYSTDEGVNNPVGFTHEERNRPGFAYGGLAYVSNTVDPNEVTLTGLRYAVLSLVWIASSLELDGARQTVIAIAEEGCHQRDVLRGDEIHHNAYKRSVLDSFSVYNRIILGTALLRLTPGLKTQLVSGGGVSLEPKSLRQARYDAPSTVHDRIGGGGPDFSRGEIVVDYYTGITDDELDCILDAAAGAGKSPVTGEE